MSFLFGISLTSSFLAGALALFAPCCITFLFPAYLGSIFKERGKVMYYTLIFAAGLAGVLVPIALGFRFAVFLLDAYHKQIYYSGAILMVFMGIMTVRPFFKMPKLFGLPKTDGRVDTVGVLGLGVMSGLTSSCCAPVLVAAVTLISLSPTALGAVAVALAYVSGIVVPLFVMSLVYGRVAAKVTGGNQKRISGVMKKLGAAVFVATGILMGVLNFRGKIVMNQMEPYSQAMRMAVFRVGGIFRNPWVDVAVFAAIMLFVGLGIRNRRQIEENGEL